MQCEKELGALHDLLAGMTVEKVCPFSCGSCPCGDGADDGATATAQVAAAAYDLERRR